MYATSKVYVVVLEQYHVKESDAVVHSSTYLHSLFLQHTHSRGCLACVEHTGLGACIYQCLLVFVGHSGYAAHALHDVEHQALCLQQTLHLTAYYHRHIALLHLGAIVYQHLHLQCGVKATEHLLSHLYASQYAIFLHQQATLAHSVGRYATQRGVVAIAYILGKTQVYEFVGQFLHCMLV